MTPFQEEISYAAMMCIWAIFFAILVIYIFTSYNKKVDRHADKDYGLIREIKITDVLSSQEVEEIVKTNEILVQENSRLIQELLSTKNELEEIANIIGWKNDSISKNNLTRKSTVTGRFKSDVTVHEDKS